LILFSDLSKIVDKFKNIELNIKPEIKINEDTKHKSFFVKISTSRGDFNFRTESFLDFPKKPEGFTDEIFEEISAKDVELINKANHYTSSDYSICECIYISDYIVATDQSVLFYEKREKNINSFELHRSIAALLDKNKYTVFTDKDKLNYKLIDVENNIELIFKKTVGDFPLYKNIIPSSDLFISKLTVKAEKLKEALDACQISKDKNSKLILFFNSIETKQLQIACNDKYRESSYSISLEVENDGENIKIGIGYNYLINILSVEKAEEYVFNFIAPNKGFKINDNILLFPMLL